MNLGKMDRQILVEKYTTTRTDSGSFVKSWSLVGTFWAKIDFKSGSEGLESRQEQGVQIRNFTIRYCKALTLNEMYRLKYLNEYYDIIFVDEIEKNKYLTLQGKRKTVYQEQ